jgi:CheY-like chemotaxis protein
MSNRLLCRAILEDYKCNFYEAIQGKEAIEIIKKSIKIDCIIMKLSMQIMNGFTTSKTIRA